MVVWGEYNNSNNNGHEVVHYGVYAKNIAKFSELPSEEILDSTLFLGSGRTDFSAAYSFKAILDVLKKHLAAKSHQHKWEDIKDAPSPEAPDIQVGTVTTGAAGTLAAVTRRDGSPNNAPIFDFCIPRGDTGSAGGRGEQGIQGIPGKDGMACRTARFVVGTSTAGWTTDDCDYLCDGTADDVEINAAIQALGTESGEILLLPGSYILAGYITLNKSSVTLRGGGMYSTTLLRGFGSTTSAPGMLRISGNQCKVQDLSINGMYSEDDSYSTLDADCGVWCKGAAITLSSIRIIDHCHYAIWSAGAPNLTVEGCRIISCHQALYGRDNSGDLSGLVFRENRISGMSQAGVLVCGNNIQICNNYFENSGKQGAGWAYAIHVWIGASSVGVRSNIHICGNIIKNCVDGIHINADYGEIRNVLIANNQIYGTTYKGISLIASATRNALVCLAQITGNLVFCGGGTSPDYGDTQYNIYLGEKVQYCYISNNYIPGKGIANSSGSDTNVIINNQT